jgi:hypothetical protein
MDYEPPIKNIVIETNTAFKFSTKVQQSLTHRITLSNYANKNIDVRRYQMNN